MAVPVAEMNLPAARPAYSVLTSERVQILGGLENALCRYFEERGESKTSNAEEKIISQSLRRTARK